MVALSPPPWRLLLDVNPNGSGSAVAAALSSSDVWLCAVGDVEVEEEEAPPPPYLARNVPVSISVVVTGSSPPRWRAVYEAYVLLPRAVETGRVAKGSPPAPGEE